MSRVIHLFSFWALVSFGVLFALQLFQITGIFLMMLQGQFWCGLAAQAFLLGLLLDTTLGRVPRFLVIVPLAAYGGYYVMYAKQRAEIAVLARQMQTSNPSMVLRFDPAVHSLVEPSSKFTLPSAHALDLAKSYEVPVVYEVNTNLKPEGHLSHRLLDREQCARARDAQARLRAQRLIVPLSGARPVRFQEVRLEEVCVLTFPEKPPLQQIIVTERGDDELSEREIMEHFVDFSLNGHVFATYRTASARRLPVFPLFLVGCGLTVHPSSWNCFAGFVREYEEIDGTPKGVDKTFHGSPESIVLGLRRYVRSDYTNFKGNSSSSAAIERMDLYPREEAQFEREQKADCLRNSLSSYTTAESRRPAGLLISCTSERQRRQPK
jgi:hypothetical protein